MVLVVLLVFFFFFFNDTATTEIYTLSLHDALPISSTNFPFTSPKNSRFQFTTCGINSTTWTMAVGARLVSTRSGEHTSELQSPCNLVCRLLLEKKKTELFEHFSLGES